MKPVTLILLYLSLFWPSICYQFPLPIPFLQFPKFQVSNDTSATSENATHRIAIIGAGAAGSSAAFWLFKAHNRSSELSMEVEVFEKEAYVGGRSTIVYPYNSTEYDPVELGASIFVNANKNLWRATEEFNLSLNSFEGDDDGELGIWDGSIFRFRAKTKGGSFNWWDMVRFMWRYGIDAPRRSQAIVKDMIDTFTKLYDPTTPSWSSITNVSNFLGFENLTAQTTEAFMDSQKINKKYSSEMIESMTRVNYGQNIDEIHALEGLVSLAASGASGVQGGNYQIFEQFLARSGAKVHLNTKVSTLTRKLKKWILVTDDGQSHTYDSVILAAPFHSTGIRIKPKPRTPIPKQPYVHLHVTYIATSSPMPNPEYFSLPEDSQVPTTILTTNDGYLSGGPAPEFNSVSFRKTSGHGGRPDASIVKIFSAKALNDTWLAEVFGKVGWVHRKEWDAYPWLPPTTTFPPVNPEEGLYYVNSFEPFISTMETETISSQNVVQLLIDNVWGGDAAGCDKGNKTYGESDVVMKGWDC